MTYIGVQTDSKYEIIKYTSGGAVRDRLSGDIVAEYTNWWTKDGSVHQKTQEQLDTIRDQLGINIIV